MVMRRENAAGRCKSDNVVGLTRQLSNSSSDVRQLVESGS